MHGLASICNVAANPALTNQVRPALPNEKGSRPLSLGKARHQEYRRTHGPHMI